MFAGSKRENGQIYYLFKRNYDDEPLEKSSPIARCNWSKLLFNYLESRLTWTNPSKATKVTPKRNNVLELQSIPDIPPIEISCKYKYFLQFFQSFKRKQNGFNAYIFH